MPTAIQLRMPKAILGNPARINSTDSYPPNILFPGCKVVYIGNLRGGPQKGSIGTVLKTGQNKVFVELNKENNWYIAKFLLRALN